MDGIFFDGHWKDTAQTTNCAYIIFFGKFTSTSNIFVVPLFWKLFRMIQQNIQNNATNLFTNSRAEQLPVVKRTSLLRMLAGKHERKENLNTKACTLLEITCERSILI